MSSKSKQVWNRRSIPSVVLVMLVMMAFLGSAPSRAAALEERPAFASSPISAFSDVVAGWLGSVWQAGRDTATAIWSNYGIAIDPDGAPADPSRRFTVDNGTPAAH